MITGSADDETLAFGAGTAGLQIPITFHADGGTDTIVGPDTSSVWLVTGAGSGSLNPLGHEAGRLRRRRDAVRRRPWPRPRHHRAGREHPELDPELRPRPDGGARRLPRSRRRGDHLRDRRRGRLQARRRHDGDRCPARDDRLRAGSGFVGSGEARRRRSASTSRSTSSCSACCSRARGPGRPWPAARTEASPSRGSPRSASPGSPSRSTARPPTTRWRTGTTSTPTRTARSTIRSRRRGRRSRRATCCARRRRTARRWISAEAS